MPVPENIKLEVDVAKGRPTAIPDMEKIGSRSVLACPDCHGVMWEIEEGELTRYRCHVGHTYSAEMMNLALDENLRYGLATALRALEERRQLARNLEEQARRSGHAMLAASWSQKAGELENELAVVRGAIRRLDDIVSREPNEAAAE